MVERTLPKPDTRVRFPSAAPQAFCPTAGGFLFWVVWVEAVCSLLLQGTRPRSASDTLMSRRNIPTSPLPLFPSPGRWSSGCGCRGRGANRGLLGLGRVCGNAEGDAEGRYRRQLAQNEDWVQGAYPQACARPSYTFLKRHQGARALRGRVPL